MPATVHLVLGLLGSGKTSLLRHLLDAPHGERPPACLVGEFAEIGFDGAALRDSDAEVIEIAGVRPDAEAWVEPLCQLVGAAGGRRILLETSGVTDAARLVSVLSAEPRLAGAITWGRVVAVIDAALFGRLRDDFAGALDAQLAVADLVVVNKIDRVDADAEARIAAHVRARRPEVDLAFTFMGQVSPTRVFRPRENGPLVTALAAQRTLDALEAFVYRSDRVCFDRAHFGHRLLNPPGGRLLRVKGHVRDHARTWAVTGVPGQLDWLPAEPVPRTAIAFIGTGMAAAEPAICADLDAELVRQAADFR